MVSREVDNAVRELGNLVGAPVGELDVLVSDIAGNFFPGAWRLETLLPMGIRSPTFMRRLCLSAMP